MRLVKIDFDSNMFLTQPDPARCDFLLKNFEAVMQMYKTQGPTFWLRLLISFKSHLESRYFEHWVKPFWKHQDYVRVMDFIYIGIHKRFIEASNTAIKKFLNNLVDLTLNSPAYLKFNYEKWVKHVRSNKQLYNTCQNLFGAPEVSDCAGCGFAAFFYLVAFIYTNFFCAVCSVFEMWQTLKDLTDEEIKKIDTKITYWQPKHNYKSQSHPFCFERYLSNYWKENLQKMIMTNKIHNFFAKHGSEGCCSRFENDKNIFRFVSFIETHSDDIKDLVTMLNIVDEIEEELDEDEACDHDDEDCSHKAHTYLAEVRMKTICVLKPHCLECKDHKKCFVKIHHNEKCLEPFWCKGESPCIRTCETKLKNFKKKVKNASANKFWKTFNVDTFPCCERKRHVSTQAEAYNKDLLTYLHSKKSGSFDITIPWMALGAHHCIPDIYNIDFNPRKTECLNRLRKKLSEKNPSAVPHFNPSALAQDCFRESLLQKAEEKLQKLKKNYCALRKHDIEKCGGNCYDRDANTVAINSSDAFGRVVLFSKTKIAVPEFSNLKNSSPVPEDGDQTIELSCKYNLDSHTKSKEGEEVEKIIQEIHKSQGCTDDTADKTGPCDSSAEPKNDTAGEMKVKLKIVKHKSGESVSYESYTILNNTASVGTTVTDALEDILKAGMQKHTAKSEKKHKSIIEKKNDEIKDFKKVENNKCEDCNSELPCACSIVDDMYQILGIKSEQHDAAVDEDVAAGYNAASSISVSDCKSKASEDEDFIRDYFEKLGLDSKAYEKQKAKVPNVPKSTNTKRLRMCANCNKKEVERRSFKRCGRCVEENFPVHHYYCSQECAEEDWIESHEDEHLRFEKNSS